MILLLLCLIFQGLIAQNSSYYLSLDGNDTANGLTPETAWRTISKINQIAFQPGDRILFRAGDTFPGTLNLEEEDGNDPDNALLVSSFGDGRATLDAMNGFGIVINNTEGITIQNLEIKGSGMNNNSRSGIYVVNLLESDFKLSDIVLQSLEISGFGEAGIAVQGSIGNSGFRNMTIDSVSVHDCLDNGIVVVGDHSQTKIGYAHQNISVKNSIVYNIPGYDKEYHSGSGIMISDVQDSVIEHCVVYNCGYGNTQCGGPVGIWYFDSDRATIQYCEAYNMRSGTGCDGGGFDLDGGVTNSVMQYNYSHDNDGAGFLVGQYTDSRPMYNITVRYNISENDARTNGNSIYLFNLNPQSPPERINIYHNTVFVSPSAANPTLAAAGALKALNFGPEISFVNNLFYASGKTALIKIPENLPVAFINNLYFADDTPVWDYHNTIYSSIQAFRNSGNEILDNEPVGFYADPLLIQPGEGGTIGYGNNLGDLPAYQLEHRSPALNVAITLADNDSPVDFFGNSAVLGPQADIGAYELDDKIPPRIFLEGDHPYTMEAGSTYEDPGARTDDGSEVFINTDSLKTKVGTYHVVYSSTDLYGNSSQITRTINVVDTQAPKITCDEIFLELNASGSAEVTEEFMRANVSDPSDFDIEFESQIYTCEALGLQKVSITATDIYGNSSNCNASVNVIDLIPPQVHTLSEELLLDYYVPEKETIKVPDFRSFLEVSDNCTLPEEMELSQYPPAGTTLRSGTYELVFTLTDGSENSTMKSFVLNVIEGIPDDGDLFIYPNPVKSLIKFNKNVIRTTIYDQRGARVFETYNSRPDLSFLQKGIYLLEVVTEDGITTKKVLKN